MKSVVLCEGPDDLWFLAYYLHKVAGWDTCRVPKDIWRYYEPGPLSSAQEVVYLRNGMDGVAIWAVSGKDSFARPIETSIQKFVMDYPNDPLDSIVIMRDRDNDPMEDILKRLESFFPVSLELSNKISTPCRICIDGETTSTVVTPVIIPFSEDGAIETLLLNSIRESDESGELVVDSSENFVSSLANSEIIQGKYLTHERLLLKAKYAATISIVNPGHSTGLFQDLVMSCPWETSLYVKEHFDVILNAITSRP